MTSYGWWYTVRLPSKTLYVETRKRYDYRPDPRVLGVYWVQAVEEVDTEASHRVNVVYRLRADGKLEVITETDESLEKLERRKPHDMIELLGALDVDRDGALELVVSRTTETDDAFMYSRSLEIYRKQGPTQRWQLIYATVNNVQTQIVD